MKSMKASTEYDEKSILARETFEEIYAITDDYEREARLTELRCRAEELGKACGDSFKRLWRAYKKQADKDFKARTSARQSNMTDFGYGGSDGHEYSCGAWVADDDGVRQYNPYGPEFVACNHPIFIEQILNNAETKKQKVKLIYRVAGKWGDIVVDKGVISSASKITALAEYGINATSENAKYLVKYLADFENLNIDIIERKTSTSKFGWVGDEFVPYGTEIGFDSKERFQELFGSVGEKGSFDEWIRCVKGVRKSGRKEPLVYLAGSFASILLCKLDFLPFVINLWEETGKGKTVSMMVAASVWGDPRIGKFMTDVGATGTSFEVRSDVLNHLPLMIDDLSKVKESYKDAFTDLIYAWCSGKGKDRSDQNLGLRKNCTWNNITMTSYERPLAGENMRGGAVNRVLDFQIESGNIFDKESGNATVAAITRNYGFAGRKFVDVVRKVGIDEIRKLQQSYLERIDDYCLANSLDKEDKQKLPMSVLLAADKLATDHIFKDGIYLDFNWCVGQLKGVNDVSENQRAYENIMDEVNVHINCFTPDDAGNYRGEFWGGFKGEYVYIIPSVFNAMADRCNFSAQAFLKWADTKGLLLLDKDRKRLQKTERIPVIKDNRDGKKVTPKKFYAIKIRGDEETQPKADAPEVTQPPGGIIDPDADGFVPAEDELDLMFG